MKKFTALLLTVALSTALLAGCNSGSASNSSMPDTNSSGESKAATSSYPKNPISVVVPYGAGGGTDLFCRVVTDKMSQSLGVPIEIINVTGGGGTIGATQVAEAPTDGYKLGFCISAPLAVMPLYGQTSYKLEDIQPICGAYSTLNVIAVANDSPIKNVDDLIKYINDKDGKVSYGGSGNGNIQHLTMEEWFKQAGEDKWEMTCVAYTDGDSAEAVALMSGEVPFAVMQAQGVKSYVEEKNLRVLLVLGDTLPKWMADSELNVPTTKETGYKCTIAPLIGFWGPAGISPEVSEAINKAFLAASKDPDVLKALDNLGLEIDYRTADEYLKALKELEPVAEALLKELGMI